MHIKEEEKKHIILEYNGKFTLANKKKRKHYSTYMEPLFKASLIRGSTALSLQDTKRQRINTVEFCSILHRALVLSCRYIYMPSANSRSWSSYHTYGWCNWNVSLGIRDDVVVVIFRCGRDQHHACSHVHDGGGQKGTEHKRSCNLERLETNHMVLNACTYVHVHRVNSPRPLVLCHSRCYLVT